MDGKQCILSQLGNQLSTYISLLIWIHRQHCILLWIKGKPLGLLMRLISLISCLDLSLFLDYFFFHLLYGMFLSHKKIISWFSGQQFQKQMLLGSDKFFFLFHKNKCSIFLYILTMCNSYLAMNVSKLLASDQNYSFS